MSHDNPHKTFFRNPAQRHRPTDAQKNREDFVAALFSAELGLFLKRKPTHNFCIKPTKFQRNFLPDPITQSVSDTRQFIHELCWATVTSNGSPYATEPQSCLSCLCCPRNGAEQPATFRPVSIVATLYCVLLCVVCMLRFVTL